LEFLCLKKFSNIGRLNHIAIAVPDIDKASNAWKKALGAKISSPQILPEHGVKVVFIEAPNTKVELLEPLDQNSPISKFLLKNPNGGMHHICYEVEDILTASKKLILSGAKILGDGTPRIGAHGNPVIFLNPSDFSGTLIELEEVK
jgi:methylmalonyl-CoA/ethylmalonyl-CoA epimerase